ncbi:MAG: cytochrome C oxidase subunit I [Aquificaceae bacterium]
MERRWFLLSIFSLGFGGLLAFLVAMARTPVVYKLFPPGYFYYALIGHVDFAIVIFLLSFTALLWTRVYKTGSKVSFYLSLLGFLFVAVPVVFGTGLAVSNNYLPTIVHPLFFLGMGFFFSGFSLQAILLLGHGGGNILSRNPLHNALAVSLFLTLLMVLAVLPSYLRAGNPSDVYLFYERLFWSPGHIHQFLNGAVLVFAWYYLLELLGRRRELGLLRYANLSFLVFGFVLLLVPVFYKDPVSYSAKVFTEISYAVGLGIPMFLHAFNVLKSTKLYWKNPYSSSLILSVILYLLGVLIAYAGIRADLRVPAHYHGTVTSLTLALMAVSYYLVQEYGYTKRLSSITKIQPYLYGVGMVLFILGLYFAGKGGAPRKTYGTAYTQDPVVLISLTLMGFGTLMAVVGGVMFVVYILRLTMGRAVYEEEKVKG